MSDEPKNGHAVELLFLDLQTALHPGSGDSAGKLVDTPVQCERHTQWRRSGSARRGSAIRAANMPGTNQTTVVTARGRTKTTQTSWWCLAGEVDESWRHALALSFTDARILAFPARSLKRVRP